MCPGDCETLSGRCLSCGSLCPDWERLGESVDFRHQHTEKGDPPGASTDEGPRGVVSAEVRVPAHLLEGVDRGQLERMIEDDLARRIAQARISGAEEKP